MSRALTILAGWALLFWASPGVIGPDGSMLVAILGVGVVGSALARPLGEHPRRTQALEWLAGGLGATLALWWVYYVSPPSLLFMVLVLGFYQWIAGCLIRRLRRRLDLGPAVALGWLGAEMLRTLLIPPLGLGWLQLGHHAAHHPWLAGSARLWGVEGLSFVLLVLGGLLAQWFVERKLTKQALLLAASCFALACALSALTAPTPMVPGPTAMIVQPGLTQEEKFRGEFFGSMQQQSMDALQAHQERGGGPVDFVAWGESMMPLPLAEPGVLGVLRAGGNLPEWREPLTPAMLADWDRYEQRLLLEPFLQELPEGTHLLTGVEVHDVEQGGIQRYVGTALFGPEGRLGRVAKKRFLVPGGETMLGFERFGFIRELVRENIGYTPDFRPGSETGILELPGQGERAYRIAALACFDNAFAEPSIEALSAGPVDLLAVTSNEAWYQDACEMDQMVAFSRLLAISTGRSILRVTNSGVSLLIGPDGREIERLTIGGSDRSVRGSLVVTIPVPEDPGAGGPPYVGLRDLLRAGIALFLGALLWICRGSKSQAG